MTNTHHNAPVPVGDVVPGDPPVPITVWPVPAPRRGETMSNAMGVRLVHGFTHPGDLIIDLTEGPQLARAIINARRRSHLQSTKTVGWGRQNAPLIVTGWPVGAPEGEFFAACRAKLTPGGCVAVLLAHGDPTLPADVVAAAKAARLAYLQHIVAATDAIVRNGTGQLSIHTDVLILTKGTLESGGTDD
ncbi:hypothetical protein [Allorhizocola rhizosphaerae]|uniref:hypothetical protein n=1 Tax=Allorhizocola rhizosphaerae TaxID=1872709 RepID=UPI001FE37FC9|nr:hypothetical protein [Allorhizocola rhizosphaerae]